MEIVVDFREASPSGGAAKAVLASSVKRLRTVHSEYIVATLILSHDAEGNLYSLGKGDAWFEIAERLV
jgi:hypothetical protein